MKEEIQVELLKIAAQMTATTLQAQLFDKSTLLYEAQKNETKKDPVAIERAIFDCWLEHLKQAIKSL